MSASDNARLWPLLLLALLIPVLPWLAFGVWFEALSGAHFLELSHTAEGAWWVGPVGALLLCVDSFLPIPSTLVESALGYALGWFVGGLWAALGLIGSGLSAWWVCRRWGSAVALRLAGEAGLERLRGAFQRHGPLLIAATRSVPLLQEASSCLAGMGGVELRRYLPSLVLGSVPTGLAYAAVGASAMASMKLALLLSLALPLLSWPLVWFVVRRRR